MFVLTADQRSSRRNPDLVPAALERIAEVSAGAWIAGPERTVGDEMQLACADPALVLTLVLELTRTGQWSVGVGAGSAQTPLPASIREASGAAFVNARDAVETAKRTPFHFAFVGGPRAADTTAVVDLLLDIRARRTEKGWEAYDLLQAGRTQREVAQALRVSPTAISLRVRSAGIHSETAAVPAIVRMLGEADAAAD